LLRIESAAVILGAILGATWIIGEKQDFASIGTGGVNARLLPKVGDPAPELFTLYADGQPMLLSGLRGQPVWINFWGSWCQPCRAETPDLVTAYNTLAPKGVVMLAISIREDPADAVNYAHLSGMPFPILIDPAYVTGLLAASGTPTFIDVAEDTRSWQVNNFPTHIFIDRDAIVRAVVIQPLTVERALAYGELILADSPGVVEQNG
jgi:thiol-disulfide isomerase/thioredoxin